MNIDVRRLNNVAIMTLNGQFDRKAFGIIEASILELVDAGYCRLVFNLHGVGVVDPAGLSILTKAKQICGASNGDIFLCAVRPRVVVMLEIAQLHTTFAMFDSEQEAIGAFFVAPITPLTL